MEGMSPEVVEMNNLYRILVESIEARRLDRLKKKLGSSHYVRCT